MSGPRTVVWWFMWPCGEKVWKPPVYPNNEKKMLYWPYLWWFLKNKFNSGNPTNFWFSLNDKNPALAETELPPCRIYAKQDCLPHGRGWNQTSQTRNKPFEVNADFHKCFQDSTKYWKQRKPTHHIKWCIFLFVVPSINKTLIFYNKFIFPRRSSSKRFHRRRSEKSLRSKLKSFPLVFIGKKFSI